MGQIDNMAQGNLADIFRRLRALEHASNMNSSAVGRGGIRVHGGGGITIENGGLVVSGSATISGLLEATGTINMSGVFTASGDVNLNGPVDIAGNTTITGDVTSAGHFTQTGPTDLNGVTTIAGNTNVTGDFTVTGPTDLNGETTIAGDTTVTGTFDVDGPMTTTGTLDVEGVTTLKATLNITSGKIVASGLTIDPAVSGGSLIFAGGGGMQGTSGVTVVKGFGNAGLITDTNASLFSGGMSLDVSPAAVTVNGGPLRIPGMTSTSSAANVYYDTGTGQLYYKP